MNAYKAEVLVIDFGKSGKENIIYELENSSHFISPQVKKNYRG